MDRNELLANYNNYPWASEVTLTAILMAMSKDKDVLANEMRRIKREFDRLDDSSDQMKSVGKILKDYGSQQAQTTLKTIDSLTKDIDPLVATSELLQTVSNVTSATGDAIGDLVKNSTRIANSSILKLGGKTVGGVFNLLGSASAGIAAGAAVTAKVMSDYDTNMKAFIDFGAIDSNLNAYSDAIDAAGQVGMSIQELHNAMGNASYVFANVNDSVLTGHENFAEFVESIATGPNAIGKLGFKMTELAHRVAQETKHVYDMTGITELDQQSKQTIIDNLKQSTVLATFLANATGEKRSELLDERDELLNDIDIASAIKINANELMEMYGENAQNVVNEAYASLGMVTRTLDPELRSLILESTKRGIMNTRFDTDIMNDLGEELAVRLGHLPETVRDGLLGIMQSVVSDADSLTKESMLGDMGKIISDLADEDLKDVRDSKELRDLQDSIIAAKSAMQRIDQQNGEWTLEALDKIPNNLNSASKAIDSMDNIRATLRTSLNSMTNHYDKLQKGLDFFQTGLIVATSTIQAILPNTLVDPQEMAQKRLEEMRDKQKAQKKALDDYNKAVRERDMAKKEGNLDAEQNAEARRLLILEQQKMSSVKDLQSAARAQIRLGSDKRTVVVRYTQGSLAGSTVTTDVKSGVTQRVDKSGNVYTSLNNARNPEQAHASVQDLNALGEFLGLIGMGEARGSYNASNRGTKGGKIIGADFETRRMGRLIQDLTIDQIKSFQSLDIDDPNRLFVVGKYQFNPSTFKNLADMMDLDGDTKFTPEVQDRMAQYLLAEDTSVVKSYLSGSDTYTSADALFAASKIWAALPVGPAGLGRKNASGVLISNPNVSYFSGQGGNKANINVGEAINLLDKARIDASGTAESKPVSSPTPKPKSLPSVNPTPWDTSLTSANTGLSGQTRENLNNIQRYLGEAANNLNSYGLGQQMVG